jgi:hypothetical protein
MADSGKGAAPSDRPKRDAAKKFLDGADGVGPGGKVDGRKSLGGDASGARGQPGPRKGGGKSSEGGQGKRPAGNEKKRQVAESNRTADVPKVSCDAGIRRLDIAALKRYKKHFNLKNVSTNSKDDLQAAVIRHFASQLRADSGKTERSFLKFLKERERKQD